MHAARATASPADAAMEMLDLSAGLAILTIALFPLALPGLVLFVLAPAALVALSGALLTAPFIVPLVLARTVRRRRSRPRDAPASHRNAAPAMASARP